MVKVTKSYTRQSTNTSWYNSTTSAEAHRAYVSKNHNRSSTFQESADGLVRLYSITYPNFEAYIAFTEDNIVQNGISTRKQYNSNNNILESTPTLETI